MNKLEITDVMICEWDADTKCIIVSPAEGWKVNVPISEAHASLVTMEKMDPDWSHLIGKWVKYWLARFEHIPEYGKWFRVNDVKWDGQDLRVYVDGWHHDDGTCNEVWKKIDEHSCCFDLTDALDYNPDEKPEPKPRQLKEYDAVECSPEERAEIIRIAEECGVPVNDGTREFDKDYPKLSIHNGGIESTSILCKSRFSIYSAPDFISKIRGTYREVNVSEHKHPEIV